MMTSPSDRATAAAANRAAFPELAEIVDDFRRVFGPGVRLVSGTEGGRTLGHKKPPTAGELPRGAACEGGDGRMR